MYMYVDVLCIGQHVAGSLRLTSQSANCRSTYSTYMVCENIPGSLSHTPGGATCRLDMMCACGAMCILFVCAGNGPVSVLGGPSQCMSFSTPSTTSSSKLSEKFTVRN